MSTSVVEKWASCAHSVAYGFGGEDGYALRQEGFNENYGCLHPEVLKSAETTGSFMEDGERVLAVVLCGIGRFDDPEVLEVLTRTCGSCRYFKARQRVS